MLLCKLICLAVSTTLGATPPVQPAVTPAISTDSTQTPLTVDALKRMTTFWTAFKKEPLAVRDTARRANQETVGLGIPFGTPPLDQTEASYRVVNMIAMANKFPSVAADLKAAGLTAQQWEAYRRSLVAAWAVAHSGGPSSAYGIMVRQLPVWKNVEFIHAHKQELDALVATGMWFPTQAPPLPPNVPGGMGGGDDNLNP